MDIILILNLIFDSWVL